MHPERGAGIRAPRSANPSIGRLGRFLLLDLGCRRGRARDLDPARLHGFGDLTDQVDDQGVKVAMIDIGESRFELLEAIRDDSPIGKFVAKRGEGLHHIAVQVDNIEASLAQLKASGVRLIDEKPRRGAHNTRVAFIHPAGTHGVLLELVEHAK